MLIFIHVATIGRYNDIFQEILKRLSDSGLYQRADEINIGVAGNKPLHLPDDKIKIVSVGNLDQFEFITLKQIQIASNSQNANILYLHTKGVSFSNECIEDWRKYMLYFLVNKSDVCIKELETFDTVGVDWRMEPCPHYSGNFWWSKSSYLKTLPSIEYISSESYKPLLTLRHNAEFWIGMNTNVKAKSLWDCGINQMQRHLFRYPESMYIKETDEN